MDLIRNFTSQSSIAGPSFSITVVFNHSVILQQGIGKVARRPAATATTIRTLYHMASISKTFVALAIMQLVEMGKLSLNDTIVQHLPYFKLPDPRPLP